MSYYNVCVKCGANLDPGETCTCEHEAEEKRKKAESLCHVIGKTNQFSINFQEVKHEKTMAC